MVKLEPFSREDIADLLGWLEGTDARFLYQFAGPKYSFPLSADQLELRVWRSMEMPFFGAKTLGSPGKPS
jgi:hypothetical protein